MGYFCFVDLTVSEKLMMIKELLDARVVSPDVILTDSELQSKYIDHLFEIMGNDSVTLSPVNPEGDRQRSNCYICYDDYGIQFVPNRCRHCSGIYRVNGIGTLKG